MRLEVLAAGSWLRCRARRWAATVVALALGSRRPARVRCRPRLRRVGVPREVYPGEKRVATVPDVVGKLVKLGFSVAVESGAGDLANFSDEVYRTAHCAHRWHLGGGA